MYDSSAVSDGVGEWFELQNVAGEALSLKTMVFSDEGSDSFTLADLDHSIRHRLCQRVHSLFLQRMAMRL